MSETIKLQTLTREFQRGQMTVQALKGVDLTIQSGEFVALVGPSGSGKSTLMNLLGGLDRPSAGELWLDGLALHDANEKQLTAHRRDRVGFIFQSFNLLPKLTAVENVAIPLMLAGVSKAERQQHAAEMLQKVGLGHRLDHFPTEMSGGEQQRTAVARALINNPALILADEPTGNLDSKTGDEVMDLLQKLNKEQGITLIVVTHDNEVADYADRIVKLRDGEIVEIEEKTVVETAVAEPVLAGIGAQGAERGEAYLVNGVQYSNDHSQTTPIPYPSTSSGQVPQSPIPSPQSPVPNPQSPIPSPQSPTTNRLSFRDIAQTAYRNLGRRPIRNILTAGGVIIGIVTLVAMVSFGVGVQREIQRNFETIGLENVFVNPSFDGENTGDGFDPFAAPSLVQPITPDIVEQIESFDEVDLVTPILSLPSGIDINVVYDGIEYPIRVSDGFGESRFSFFETNETVAGQTFGENNADSGVVIGPELADLLLSTGQSYDDLIGANISLLVRLPRGESTTFDSTLMGIREGAGRSTIDLGVDERADIKAWWFNDPNILENEGYDFLTVQAVDINSATAVINQVDALNLESQSLGAILEVANQVLSLMQALLGSVGGLALLVAALGVANTMMMAIYERTREIGVLKALGASAGEIRKMFTTEAALIGFIGGVFGLIFGILLGRLVNFIGQRFLLAEGVTGVGNLSVVPPWLALGAIAFAAFIGVVAGLYPAARAARLDPVTALRHE
ncbi:MAG: ATP-binding cassette domain-containing protein [Chloroflexota bacterium]